MSQRLALAFIILAACSTLAQTPAQSNAWIADQGDGTYKNPILYADYSDPDVTARNSDLIKGAICQQRNQT